jgi:hypothetical protein
MSDLGERLREGVNGQAENFAMRNEAAARIDALEAALREIRDLPRVSYAAAAQVMAEIARAALEPEQGK